MFIAPRFWFWNTRIALNTNYFFIHEFTGYTSFSLYKSLLLCQICFWYDATQWASMCTSETDAQHGNKMHIHIAIFQWQCKFQHLQLILKTQINIIMPVDIFLLCGLVVGSIVKSAGQHDVMSKPVDQLQQLWNSVRAFMPFYLVKICFLLFQGLCLRFLASTPSISFGRQKVSMKF